MNDRTCYQLGPQLAKEWEYDKDEIVTGGHLRGVPDMRRGGDVR